MRTHTEDLASPRILELFTRIRGIVQRMGDVRLHPEAPVSCHMLAHAVAAVVPGVKAVDGLFRDRWQHSWLSVSLPRIDVWIVDVYPIGVIGGPLLLYADLSSPWHALYVEKDIDVKNFPMWENHLVQVVTALRKGL